MRNLIKKCFDFRPASSHTTPMEPATQVIIFIVALLISAGFLALIIVLIPALRELKNLFVDLQKTSTEARELMVEARKISENVEGKLEGIDGLMANAQKITSSVGRAASLLNNPAIRQFEWLAALIPAVLLGWKAVSKIRGRNKEEE
jgi:hypothetical protein